MAYTWDDLGRLTSDGTYSFTWDAASRLITVTDGISTYGFRYDGDGNRLTGISNGTFTTYAPDVGLALPEVLVEQGSGRTTRYLHLPNAIATDDGLAWSYSAADGLGSIRQQLDASGQVGAINSYRPFGLPLEGNGGDPYGYTGEWWDYYIKLTYLRSRWYDPGSSRFLSPDSIIPDYAFPPSIHRYSYALNNPIRFVDPSGRQGTPYPPTPEATPQPRPTPPPLSTGTPTPQPADPQTSEWWSPYDPNWWSSPYEYDVARRHDPLFGNPYYYDPLYANDPVVSANFALWRSGAIGCWKCHVTHWRGRIPTNEQLSAYLIDSWHCFDKLKPLIILTALGLHASQTSLSIDDSLFSRQPPQLRAGNLAHDQLEQQYLESVPPNQRAYVDLDEYFTDPWTGKRFKPDVVNHWTGEILEYKPITYQGNPSLERQAVQQAASYADRLNAIYGDLRAMQGVPEYWWRVVYYVK